MELPKKMLIAGVGGMGIVYLTNLVTEAALLADIPVAASEIHGLAQRRGSVISGITLGENTYGGIEGAGADYLIGLEPLEAIRCLNFLHTKSRVIIDDHQIYPHMVNAGKAPYPDVERFVSYLNENIEQVVVNQSFDTQLNPILRNIYILGRATALEGFPIPFKSLEESIRRSAKEKYRDESLKALRLGKEFG